MQYDFKKLKDARIRKRITQTELARRAGLSVGTISMVESGRAPWLKAIRELEEVLGVRSVIKEQESA